MSTISASTTSTTAYKVTADTTGTLVFQTGASPTTAMSISSSQIISFTNPPTATGGGSVSTNTAYGTSALQANTTGANITAVGYQAGYSNTDGGRHTFIGTQAGYSNTSGLYNAALGFQSLYTNTTGNYNSAIGYGSLLLNTTGSNNVAVGHQSLFSNTTASNNTAVGYQAGYTNSTGAYNTFMGYQAGYYTTGTLNAFYGNGSGANATGSYNSFFGEQSGYAITSGTKNTIIGRYTGNQGGLDIRTASNYIVLSDGDGNPRMYYHGSNNYWTTPNAVWLQSGVLPSSTGVDNSRIFNSTSGTTGTVTLYIGNASITTSSDVRLKENIVDSQRDALDILGQLRVVDHTWNDPSDTSVNNRNSRGVWTGLIAQEAQPIIPWLVNKPLTDEDEEGNPQYWHMDYGYAVPLLIKAIQELKAEIDTLKGQA